MTTMVVQAKYDAIAAVVLRTEVSICNRECNWFWKVRQCNCVLDSHNELSCLHDKLHITVQMVCYSQNMSHMVHKDTKNAYHMQIQVSVPHQISSTSSVGTATALNLQHHVQNNQLIIID